MSTTIDDRVAELERANAELRRQFEACSGELKEARDQQTATAEVLQVINSSPGELAPVFDAMLEKAMHLCGAAFGTLWTYDGDRFRPMAYRGVPARYAEFLEHNAPLASAGTGRARILAGERVIHVSDLADEKPYRAGDPHRRALVDLGGARTGLIVPLLKHEEVLGYIRIYRQEVRPFSDKQVALLQNFAAQAVIAMENARLITETREALEQQTATAEVLQVINSSPGDLAPVFDAILEKAMRLCGAAFGMTHTVDGTALHLAARRSIPPLFADFAADPANQPGPGGATPRLIRDPALRFVHVIDLKEEEAYRSGDPYRRALVDIGGARTLLAIPLRKDGVMVGVINIYRQEVRAYSEKEIAVMGNFAAQAVIAMENARLITETREALEQQTATAEVLQVINSSPGDLAPVFDAILEKAHMLCGVASGGLVAIEGGRYRPLAVRGEPGFAEAWMQQGSIQFSTTSAHAQQLRRGEPVHIPDFTLEERSRWSDESNRLIELSGSRCMLVVPLRKDDVLFGAITALRKEAQPFYDKEIALLENFAAQAVIAMENARLLTETREALEQQTATAEVLQVINSSPGDLAPVFDAMLERALALCGGAHGVIVTFDGQRFHLAAGRGEARFVDWLRRNTPFEPSEGSTNRRVIDGEDIVQVTEIATEQVYRAGDPVRHALVDIGGFRTLLSIALRKDDLLLGAIHIYRLESALFSEKQIALLQNFAAQAVIAMENARLITETREALEQQTATAEVLQVINASPGDLAPVFDAMLDKATQLCAAAFGTLFTYDGECFHAVAMRGVPAEFADAVLNVPLRPAPGASLDLIARGGPFAHFADVANDPAFTGPAARDLVELGGARSALAVPLRKDNALLGVFAVYRQEVRPFTDKQIRLLQNFAAQAVIAMENARLLGELRQRTDDLEESLEYQTATSDVLKVISQSTFDLEPVLQTVLETAIRLCGSRQGLIFRRDADGRYRLAATSGTTPEHREIEANLAIEPGPDTLVGRVVLARQPVEILDPLADPDYALKHTARAGNLRTMLGVPLLREDVPIGVFCTARENVEPFTAKQIELVQTFADQAVIAIENARLFNELRERTADLGRSVEELKMLGEVGRAVSSTLDLRTVLSTILTASLGVTMANAGAVFRYIRAERAFRLVEAAGWDEALSRSVSELHVAETESAMGQAIAARAPVELPDLGAATANPLREATLAAGFRSALIVPLVGAERVFGAITLMRHEAGEFPPETVRLMQTLASQSVLAIQNARLFREIADKSEQLALASQHKSQFLANMSHELRTPLNAILGYAELLVDGIYGVLPEKAQGVLERVQNNGKHLLALINDVLDLAKIEAGQLALTLEDYALAEVVRGVVTATEPLAAAKGLKFTAIVEDSMPMAHGDARRVSQVLLNLAGNAIKFTDAGEVEINASAANGQFVLTVRDTGPGIADADQERIFGEFQQIDNSNTRKKGGTGLGLAISKRMVEMQGGMISVDSMLGRGSTFRVVLPVHVEPALEEAA